MPGNWVDKHPSVEALKKILEGHKVWLCTRGRNGQRAELAGARLTKSLLTRADLRAADFTRANLTNSCLAGARFDKADFDAHQWISG